MTAREQKSKRGRPSREAFAKSDLNSVIESLHVRIEKLIGVIAGMEELKMPSVDIAEAVSMRNALDQIRRFCDDALEQLRARTKHGERTWDKWDK